MNRYALPFFLFLSLIPPLLATDIENNSARFSEQEISDFDNLAHPIEITEGYAEYKNAFGIGNGKYDLKTYTIKHVGKNLYQLQLVLEHKKGMLLYKQKEILPLLYDGKRLWIKYKNEIYRHSIENIQTLNVKYLEKGKEVKWVHPIKSIDLDKIHLKMKFY